MFEIIEGFKVIKPEPLIILKIDAEKNRSPTMKGFKDRCDILALLNLQIDKKLLAPLVKKYGLGKQLADIIKISTKEYNYASRKELTQRELKIKKQLLLAELKTLT